jgi:hypothetical protein
MKAIQKVTDYDLLLNGDRKVKSRRSEAASAAASKPG